MSSNKRKYWNVTTTQIISANTKKEAIDKARRKRGVDADLLESFVDGERISAVEAHNLVAPKSNRG